MKLRQFALDFGFKVFLIVLLQGVMLVSWAHPVEAKTLTMPEVSEMIQNHFESNLNHIPRAATKHYALRMFRITGDRKYINSVSADMLATAWALKPDLENINDPEYARKRALEKLKRYHPDSERSRNRYELLSNSGTMDFSRYLLYEMNKLDELGLLRTPGFENIDPVIDYLKTVDWASFLLSPDTIRVFSAKVINDMYFLRDVGIVDLTSDYKEAFLKTFPDEEDDELTSKEFEAKVYGLTHVILSESRYYQHMVDPEPFQWIYDWFELNFERVVRESKPDVLAELAVCYLITGQPDHPMVKRVRQALVWAFNEEAEMIPSTACNTDLPRGEHRNVMALLVFNWPEQLHPGPYLMDYEEYRRLWPQL